MCKYMPVVFICRSKEMEETMTFFLKSLKTQEGFEVPAKRGRLFGKLINLFLLEDLYRVLENITYLHG